MSDMNLRSVVKDESAVAEGLQSLPRRHVPAGLSTSLRVLASRERQRAVRRRSFERFVEFWTSRVAFALGNLMRPLAVPVAGGVFSAVALFSMFVIPTYPVRALSARVDVPTALNRVANYTAVPEIGKAGADVVVEIFINPKGRMVDYRVLYGEDLLDHDERRNLENQLVFTQFEPATSFGVPTPGTVTLYLNLNQSRIEVQG